MKTKKVRSEKHRRFVASQPCIITGYQGDEVHPHHLLRVDGVKGLAVKSCDMWCVPLLFVKHNALHANGDEMAFFNDHERPYYTVKQIAIDLAKRSPDINIRKAVEEYINGNN